MGDLVDEYSEGREGTQSEGDEKGASDSETVREVVHTVSHEIEVTDHVLRLGPLARSLLIRSALLTQLLICNRDGQYLESIAFFIPC